VFFWFLQGFSARLINTYADKEGGGCDDFSKLLESTGEIFVLQQLKILRGLNTWLLIPEVSEKSICKGNSERNWQ